MMFSLLSVLSNKAARGEKVGEADVHHQEQMKVAVQASLL